jgi:hypothetical protein
MVLTQLADLLPDTGKGFQGDFAVPEIGLHRHQARGR